MNLNYNNHSLNNNNVTNPWIGVRPALISIIMMCQQPDNGPSIKSKGFASCVMYAKRSTRGIQCFVWILFLKGENLNLNIPEHLTDIFTFENLLHAYKKASKNKRNKKDVSKFRNNLYQNIYRIEKTFKHGKYPEIKYHIL